MELYNKDKVPFKYVIGYKTGEPHQFLYQMLKYLREQNREENPLLSMAEVNLCTNVRGEDGKDIQGIIDVLISEGYVTKERQRLKIISSPWQ